MRSSSAKPAKGITLGYQADHSGDRSRIGFLADRVVSDAVGRERPIVYAGDGHLLTIAPTGSGKGVGAIIPTLLTYPGSAVVVDPKGEAAQITARRRRAMGQQVVILDPFGAVTAQSDGLNPLDVMVDEDDARAIANLLIGDNFSLRDRFWDITAEALLSGLVLHLDDEIPENRRLSRLREYFAEDFAYYLAVKLDSKAVKHQDACQEFSIFLQYPERETRPSVQATAQQHVRHFGSEAVRRATDRSTFSLQEFVDGKPMTIYLVLPPSKLDSHGNVLRLWLGALLMALSKRKRLPEHNTLLIVDEVAQLGTLGLLKTAITLMRGYGVQIWSLWQDAAQLRDLYPAAWPAMVNNAAVIQLFGARNWRMAEEYAALVGGVSAETILNLQRAQQLLLIDGGQPLLCRRSNYLQDKRYQGLFDPHPMFADKSRTVSL